MAKCNHPGQRTVQRAGTERSRERTERARRKATKDLGERPEGAKNNDQPTTPPR